MITGLELIDFLMSSYWEGKSNIAFLQALFISELMKKKHDSKYNKTNINWVALSISVFA